MSGRVVLALGLAALAATAFYGCATSENKPAATLRPTDAGAGNDDAGGADSSTGGAPDPGTSGGKGGSELNTNNGEAGVPDGACAADIFKAELVPLDMYIMLDVSGSMLEDTAMYDSNGVVISKWTAVKGALSNFVSERASNGLGVGIQYFPQLKSNVPTTCTDNASCGDSAPCLTGICWNLLPAPSPCAVNADCAVPGGGSPKCVPYALCSGDTGYACQGVGKTDNCFKDAQPIGTCTLVTDAAELASKGVNTCGHVTKCEADAYATPDTAIAVLPGAADELLASLDAHAPQEGGSTPTGPALKGALAQASAWAKEHRDHRVVAVLATDGIPAECAPTSAPELAKIAAAGLADAPSIPTFVVGVFSNAANAQGAYTVNTIAKGGGTKAAFVINTSNNVASEFRDALNSIRTTQLACEFQVPQPESKDPINYSLVNVNYRTGKKSTPLFYVGSVEECDPLAGGWYYDADPAVEDPTRIVVCPTTCTTFQGATNAAVDIAVGCQTIVK